MDKEKQQELQQKYMEMQMIQQQIQQVQKQLELLASVDFVRRTWLGSQAPHVAVVEEFKQHKTRFHNGDPIEDDEIESACDTLDQLKEALAE